MTDDKPVPPCRLPGAVAVAREIHAATDKLICDIYDKRVAWGALATAQSQKIGCGYQCLQEDPAALWAWQRLLDLMGRQSPLLTAQPVVAHFGAQAGNTFLDALLHLARYHDRWREEPELWEPDNTAPRAQFASLACFLFAHYDVPAFLDAAWFTGFTPDGEQQRDWFVHVGTGQNIRRARLPLHLTEKAAHYFMQAPADGSIVGALRYGQIVALGGSVSLANAIAESKMGQILPDEPFWESVLHFFVNNPSLPPSQVSPLVDFIYEQRVGPNAKPDVNGVWDTFDAPDPTFSMKGRTLIALQKRMEEWHLILAKDAKRPRTAWAPSGWDGLEVQERDISGGNTIWTVRELLDSRALQEEGREMRHCVFTYAHGCVSGKTSIWSLRARTPGEARNHRLLTIEVNNTRRTIVQVRGKANQTLSQLGKRGRVRFAGDILRRWARQQKLTIACSL